MNNAIIQSDKEQADQMDIMQMVVREVIKNELKLKVERKPDANAESFFIHLELNGEVIPNAFVVVSLDAGYYTDAINFEIV